MARRDVVLHFVVTPRVLHVVDSIKLDADSVAISVRGLIAELGKRGVRSEIVEVADVNGASIRARTDESTIVHFHGWGGDGCAPAVRAVRRTKTPFVMSPFGGLSSVRRDRASLWRRFRFHLGERGSVRHAAALTGVSDAEVAQLRAAGSTGKVLRLPYGVDWTGYDGVPPAGIDLPAPLAGRCLLILSPIDPVAGCVALLKAFAEIGPDANDWHVAIAGPDRGDFRKMLEAAIRRKGGEDRIMLARADDIDTQRAWLDRADALAAPRLEPGLSVSLLQAVASQVPVLATTNSLPDVLGEAVVSCSPRRAGLREGLRRMLTMTDDRRREMARHAARIGREQLDWSVLADGFVALYKGLTP